MICIFGAILIFTLWQRRIPANQPRREPGLFYLSLAVLVWALIGIGMVLKVCPKDWPLNRCLPAVMASTMNNAFLLLALAYFEYGPIEFKIAQDDWKWHFGVLVASIVVALWVLIVQSAWPDFLLSATTLSILGMSAYLTFKNRGFVWASGFSLVVILISLITRYWESVEVKSFPFARDQDWLWVLLLTAKTSLITLFLALGFSELSGKVEPLRTEELRLEFMGKEDTGNSWVVVLTVPQLFTEKKVEMPPMLHKVLLTFAVERICRSSVSGGWIKIKDKFYPSDLSRICKKLGVQTSLMFENDLSGSYRLRVPPENIKIEKQRFKMYPDLMGLLKEIA